MIQVRFNHRDHVTRTADSDKPSRYSSVTLFQCHIGTADHFAPLRHVGGMELPQRIR
jgi:hypothetical protein